MIARVRSLTAGSIVSGLIAQVWRSESTNRGVAPTAVTMAATLICYGLYVLDFQRQAGTDMRLLMLTFPIVVFGVFRYHHLTETTNMGDQPEEVLLRDRPIQLCGLGFAIVAVAALYLGA